jgi:hypothetical protein
MVRGGPIVEKRKSVKKRDRMLRKGKNVENIAEYGRDVRIVGNMGRNFNLPSTMKLFIVQKRQKS